MPEQRDGGTLDDVISDAKRMLAPMLVFSVVINLATLVIPIYMLQIYDRVLTSRNLSTLLLLTILAFSLLAVGCLLTHYRSRVASRLGMKISQQLTQPAFVAMVKMNLETKPSDGRPAQDLDSIREFFTGGNLTRLLDVPWSPIFLLVIFLLHPLTGIVASAAAFMLLIVDWTADRQAVGNLQLYAKSKSKNEQFLQSSLQGAAAIWSMGMGPGIGSNWQKKRATDLSAQARWGDDSSAYGALRRFIQQGAQMAMLGVGAYLAVREEITAGTIVAGSIICARALAPIGGAIGSWRHYGEVRNALAKLKAAAGRDDDQDKVRNLFPQTSQFRADNLAIDLGNTIPPVIQRLELILKPGESMSIVGPRSTGKSLLASTLIGARQPAEGSVNLNGIDLHLAASDQIGRMIGYVPQQWALHDGTVGQNISRFNCALRDERLEIAVERAGLQDALAQLPDGYDTPIVTAARCLPPNQLRFVALARALYGDPSLLVLDQFDAGPDQASMQIMGEIIRTSRALGQIVIWVTEQVSVVQQLDHVMILSKRGVETFCPVSQLVDRAAVAQ